MLTRLTALFELRSYRLYSGTIIFIIFPTTLPLSISAFVIWSYMPSCWIHSITPLGIVPAISLLVFILSYLLYNDFSNLLGIFSSLNCFQFLKYKISDLIFLFFHFFHFLWFCIIALYAISNQINKHTKNKDR